MKLFITGASGFVGSRLVDVARHRAFEVVPVTRRELELTDSGAVLNMISNAAPDVILHTAARIPRAAGENALTFFDDNVHSTLNIMHAAQKVGVKHVVLSSSMSVYEKPPQYLPVNEEHPIVSDNAYGVSKYVAELFAKMCVSTSMSVTVLRYSGVYGQGQKSGAIPAFIDRCLRGEPIHLDSQGMPSSDYVWVEDVVESKDRKSVV